jgi:hypothetical protein
MVPEYNISWAMGDFALIKLPKSSNKTTAYLNWIYWLPKVNDTVWIAGRGATSSDKYMLRPVDRIDRSVDWPASRRTGRYFCVSSTGCTANE